MDGGLPSELQAGREGRGDRHWGTAGGGQAKARICFVPDVSWAPNDSQATKDLDGGSCGHRVKWVREETMS